MDRTIPILLIGLVFGGGIGFTLAAANGITLDGHDHGDPSHHAGAQALHAHAAAGHDHGMPLSLPGGADAPTLGIAVEKDPVSGWNLQMKTAHFTFAPEHAGSAHVPGEGHVHVYANGVKIGRFYGSWVHLDDLPPGRVTLEVTLNANDHRPLAVDGAPVASRAIIDNGAPEPAP